MRYDAWARTHGLQPDDLHKYLENLQWVLDDPRFRAPDFEIPKSVHELWGFGQMMESELLRVLKEGPPYEPRMTLDGCMGCPQVYMLFPRAWVDFMKSMGMPEPQITMEHWKEWADLVNEVTTMADGDILSRFPYCLNDPGWSLIIPAYLAFCLDPSIRASFATNPAQLKISDADSLSVALVGDVGTGTWLDGKDQFCPAEEVMEQIAKLDADYTIHLGDIYYMGATPWVEKFIETWVPGKRGSFTMDGNHEMYAGARGLYEQALTDPKFSAQQGTTYFSIEFGNWIIAGLDTAFYDDSPLFFRGTIRDPVQKAFLRDIGRQAEERKQKVFLLTHHNVMNLNGTELSPLWEEVVAEDALGRAPDYWYWGHSHHGIVYSDLSAMGKRGTHGRCSGHGSTPHADPWELKESTGPGKTVQWYGNTPYKDDVPEHRKRILNGFTAVTFTENDVVERFINQKGHVEAEI
jgi:hypothetical protein